MNVSALARRHPRAFALGIAAVALVVVANIPTSVRVAVDQHVRVEQIPLYEKVIEFVRRDIEMRALEHRITEGVTDRDEIVERLFEWTHANVRPVPPGFPVIDDHAHNIVVRGYGTNDQAADVFVQLCGYAGIDARLVFAHDGSKVLYAFALLAIDGAWRPYDVREGRVFRDATGAPLSLGELRGRPELVAGFGRPREAREPYSVLFEKLDATDVRPVADQLPVSRLWREFERLLGR